MLKIKQDIKIKELYKYGFKRTLTTRLLLKNVCDDKKRIYISYTIDTKTRIIDIMRYDKKVNIGIDNTLYDMIQDGIVEKVE